MTREITKGDRVTDTRTGRTGRVTSAPRGLINIWDESIAVLHVCIRWDDTPDKPASQYSPKFFRHFNISEAS